MGASSEHTKGVFYWVFTFITGAILFAWAALFLYVNRIESSNTGPFKAATYLSWLHLLAIVSAYLNAVYFLYRMEIYNINHMFACNKAWKSSHVCWGKMYSHIDDYDIEHASYHVGEACDAQPDEPQCT